MCLSVPQIAVAATRINISSGAGLGIGQSRTSVPPAPSTGADLTTACMVPVRKTARIVSQRLLSRTPPKLPPHVAERGIEEELDRARGLDRNLRVSWEIAGKTVHRPDDGVGVPDVEVLVQSALHHHQRGAARALRPQALRHPL